MLDVKAGVEVQSGVKTPSDTLPEITERERISETKSFTTELPDMPVEYKIESELIERGEAALNNKSGMRALSDADVQDLLEYWEQAERIAPIADAFAPRDLGVSNREGLANERARAFEKEFRRRGLVRKNPNKRVVK